MKTTVEIADPVFKRSRELARRRHITLRMLIEEGLERMLDESRQQRKPFKLGPIQFSGGGFTSEFEGAGWDAIRDEVYKGRGA